jgi:hypothetical protein
MLRERGLQPDDKKEGRKEREEYLTATHHGLGLPELCISQI